MNRIDAIGRYAAQQKAAAERDAIEKAEQREELRQAIAALQPRIAELIQTANACLENGISISGYGTKDEFVTNSVSHKVGFAQDWCCGGEKRIYAMGINAGGACGHNDFRTTGAESYFVSETDRTRRVTPTADASIRYMRRFLTDFDAFEKRFYGYIDELVGA